MARALLLAPLCACMREAAAPLRTGATDTSATSTRRFCIDNTYRCDLEMAKILFGQDREHIPVATRLGLTDRSAATSADGRDTAEKPRTEVVERVSCI